MNKIAKASVAAGVNPPAGAAAGTGSKTTPAIVKTSNAASGNVGMSLYSYIGPHPFTLSHAFLLIPEAYNPQASAQPAVGSPGALAMGTGTLQANGACACQCLCGTGSFPNVAAMNAPPSPPAASTLATVVSPAALATTLTSAAIQKPSASIAAGAAGAATTLTSAAMQKPSASIAAGAASSSQTLATIQKPSASVAVSSPPPAVSPPPPPAPAPAPAAQASQVSSLQLSVTAAGNGAAGQAAQVAKASAQTDPINISTFSLTSSLVLGSLAQASAAPKVRRELEWGMA